MLKQKIYIKIHSLNNLQQPNNFAKKIIIDKNPEIHKTNANNHNIPENTNPIKKNGALNIIK